MSGAEAQIHITAFTARQKVSGRVGDRISHLMGGDKLTLILSHERLAWRVPLILTTPSQGTLGVIGTLDVDARTGGLLLQPDFEEQVRSRVEALTRRREA